MGTFMAGVPLPAAQAFGAWFGQWFSPYQANPLGLNPLRTLLQQLGDVAFWTRGDYFGLLFSYERPKLSAPIIVMGRMTSDLAVFDTLGDGIDMLFEVQNTTVRK